MNWNLKYFEDLSVRELYEIGRLRQEIFILEQNCPYVDFDGKDYFCYHLMGSDESGELLAYARLVPEGISYEDYVSIGRVICSASIRRSGLGRALMRESIECCERLFGKRDIKIGAQTYLLKFYESFGFKSNAIEYLEDGIPHTEMIRQSVQQQ